MAPRPAYLIPFLIAVAVSVGLGKVLRGEMPPSTLIFGLLALGLLVSLIRLIDEINDWLKRRRER